MITSAHAILITKGFDLIMQRRDTKPGIYNSGKVGIFGGSCEGEETIIECLQREIEEELCINIQDKKFNVKFHKKYTKTIEVHGQDAIVNLYLIYPVEISELTVMEGVGLAVGKSNELFNENLTVLAREVVGELSEEKVRSMFD